MMLILIVLTYVKPYYFGGTTVSCFESIQFQMFTNQLWNFDGDLFLSLFSHYNKIPETEYICKDRDLCGSKV